VTFYRDALRLPVAHDTDWFVEFQLTASSYLSIADASRATIAAVEGQGVTLSWRVADVSAARRRLIEQGLTPTDERTLWVQQSAMSATRRAIASSSGLPSDDDLGAHPRLALTFDAV
jgi:hypothetical protein